MKTLNLFRIAAATLLFTISLPAQTLKWEYRLLHSTISYNGDGRGGLAICEEYADQKARCVWIASNGRPLFTNEFDLLPENSRCDIVRLTPLELAIHFRTRASESDPVINVLRRFKRTPRGITVTEKILDPSEEMPLELPHMTDPFGFFTTGHFFTDDRLQYFAIRRYSN